MVAVKGADKYLAFTILLADARARNYPLKGIERRQWNGQERSNQKEHRIDVYKGIHKWLLDYHPMIIEFQWKAPFGI